MSEYTKFVARYWKSINKEYIQCCVCPRMCVLKDQQRGFCFVRQNVNQELILTTYGRSSGFCIDPIEKKPLNHFYPGSSILSFGTAGCNLGCKFCQNWDISASREFDRLVEQATPRAIAQTALEHGCRSVAFTYNDPIIFLEYAVDVSKECHKVGILTVAVTSGYINPDARVEFFQHMDAANIDLKAFTDKFYSDYTSGSLKPVLETLIYIKKQTDVWLEITNLLIPGINDNEEEIKQLSKWIYTELGADTPLHFTAFHPSFQMTEMPPTRPETLTRARQIALEQGLRYVYTGNVHDKGGGSTFCHQCHNMLIERDWFQLGEYHLKDKNQCGFCGTVCSGHFAEKPGDRGSNRQPLKINC